MLGTAMFGAKEIYYKAQLAWRRRRPGFLYFRVALRNCEISLCDFAATHDPLWRAYVVGNDFVVTTVCTPA
ncbi:MAG: hypothetical protein IM673_11600 [Phenylobacterium sp.]|uniref:hypothetical protein n=1 Tax=Phenylobacterium sp. TaxID=1871053 RepID=UPI0025CCB860|nr:hypothetical protein [Phenylobacterium sp.]MCA3738686.1 hypothetical protein [Phenylobacterium sp.]MCA3753519.1 hypothetical protein [Phenylobacterium sp.]MCA6328587.1 hypothetical protein [Phenylobacterium sp.]